MTVALTIAGSDPSGGAGIQADLKTFHQFGVYGEAVITLLTVQNTGGVSRVECIEPTLVRRQIEAVLSDIPPQAVKTGALGNTAIVQAVADATAQLNVPLVVDPVMISKHGAPLLDSGAAAALKTCLAPRAFLMTPNLPEAAGLSGMEVNSRDSMREAARRIQALGPRNVLVKGGHLEGDAVDILFDGSDWHEFAAPRVNTRHTHGTGCTYSAAITACLANGLELVPAVSAAKRFITEAIRTSPGLGSGQGPVNHFASSRRTAC